MKLKLQYFFILFFGCISYEFYGQNISLYNQYNGRYDFIFIGNTLNTIENNNDGGVAPPCTILTSSSASLNLNSGDTVESAYLYWAGSGTGDFDVKLNGQNITAQRTFSITNSAGFPCFSAFNDITSLVQSTGNGTYTFSDLDLTNIISNYCPTGGNFGGWAIVIVYKNAALPLNQLNIYDGMQGVPNMINITLNSLNVIDNLGAKIGFVAWEGDKNIAVNESLKINGTVLENLPLNPANNAFNGTNTFTGSDQLFNMDLDVYDIQNNIAIGDTSAQIQLTSSQDFVMINCIVTKLNSQLPDATVSIDDTAVACNSHEVLVHYTVYNTNASSVLQSGVPIAIYVNGIFIQSLTTQASIPIGGSESGTVYISVPNDIPSGFDLQFAVDDDGSNHGIVIEINENNNTDTTVVNFVTSSTIPPLSPVTSCNQGLTQGTFNFSAYENQVKENSSDIVTFYPTQADIDNNTNAITETSNYIAITTPATIYVKVDTGACYKTSSFLLVARNCPPTIYNYISANGDSKNETFHIEGLHDIFFDFKLSIYNRWGKLIWTGDNHAPEWDGHANKGILVNNATVPAGTYFYVLELNDPDYPKPWVGYLYITR